MSKLLTLLCFLLLTSLAVVYGEEASVDSHEDSFAEGEEMIAAEEGYEGMGADDESEEGSDEGEDSEDFSEDEDMASPDVFLQAYDLDGDGKISWAELDGESSGELPQGTSANEKEANEKKELDDAADDDAKALFKKSDADGDGHLSLSEIPTFLGGHMNGGKDDF